MYLLFSLYKVFCFNMAYLTAENPRPTSPLFISLTIAIALSACSFCRCFHQHIRWRWLSGIISQWEAKTGGGGHAIRGMEICQPKPNWLLGRPEAGRVVGNRQNRSRFGTTFHSVVRHHRRVVLPAAEDLIDGWPTAREQSKLGRGLRLMLTELANILMKDGGEGENS